MLPKEITPQVLIRIFLRRKWWVVAPFVLSIMVALFLMVVLPRTYKAETVILVQPQRVPEKLVMSTAANARLALISQQVMSRTRLETIVRDLNLYPDLRERQPMQKVVEMMRGKIDLQVTKADRRGRDETLNYFSIGFTHPNAAMAARVANTLASMFIEENLKSREEQAIGTTNFLDRELTSLKQKLEEQEGEIEAYRRKYMGELPEQFNTNLMAVQRLQSELLMTQQSLHAARARKILLQGQVTEMERNLGNMKTGNVAEEISEDARLSRVANLRGRLEELQLRYSDQHPYVARLKEEVAKAEQAIDTEEKPQDKPPAETKVSRMTASPEMMRMRMDYERILSQSKSEMQTVQSEIARLETAEAQIRDNVGMYQSRVDNAPHREQELRLLSRDYDMNKENYKSLLTRQMQAKTAENLEKMQKGEQFIILDPAIPPRTPESPNAMRVVLACVALGLLGGAGLAGAREFLDHSFWEDQTLADYLTLPVLATVPFVSTARQRHKERVKRLAFGAAAVVVLAGYSCGIYFLKSRDVVLNLPDLLGRIVE